MSRWFRIDSEMLFSVEVFTLDPDQFREEFVGALNGLDTILSRFVKGPYMRPPAHEWRVIRDRIFKRDNYTCGYCGARGVKLECDHIVPVSKGGVHDDANLMTACKPCNRSKSGKHLTEWIGGGV